MTIDEAIAKHRKIAKTQKALYDVCVLKECNKHFLREAEEHEQLAEWLELLKWYEQGMEDIPSESGVLPKDVYHAGYNKAIDDFVEKLIRYVDCGHLCSPTEARWSDLSVVKMVEELAEQLKVGGENDNLRR